MNQEHRLIHQQASPTTTPSGGVDFQPMPGTAPQSAETKSATEERNKVTTKTRKELKTAQQSFVDKYEQQEEAEGKIDVLVSQLQQDESAESVNFAKSKLEELRAEILTEGEDALRVKLDELEATIEQKEVANESGQVAVESKEKGFVAKTFEGMGDFAEGGFDGALALTSNTTLKAWSKTLSRNQKIGIAVGVTAVVGFAAFMAYSAVKNRNQEQKPSHPIFNKWVLGGTAVLAGLGFFGYRHFKKQEEARKKEEERKRLAQQGIDGAKKGAEYLKDVADETAIAFNIGTRYDLLGEVGINNYYMDDYKPSINKLVQGVYSQDVMMESLLQVDPNMSDQEVDQFIEKHIGATSVGDENARIAVKIFLRFIQGSKEKMKPVMARLEKEGRPLTFKNVMSVVSASAVGLSNVLNAIKNTDYVEAGRIVDSSMDNMYNGVQSKEIYERFFGEFAVDTNVSDEKRNESMFAKSKRC